MTKDELVKHMQDVIDEVISQDKQSWEELEGLLEREEIELDKAFHNGYMSAINTVRSLLNDK